MAQHSITAAKFFYSTKSGADENVGAMLYPASAANDAGFQTVGTTIPGMPTWSQVANTLNQLVFQPPSESIEDIKAQAKAAVSSALTSITYALALNSTETYYVPQAGTDGHDIVTLVNRVENGVSKPITFKVSIGGFMVTCFVFLSFEVPATVQQSAAQSAAPAAEPRRPTRLKAETRTSKPSYTKAK